MQAVVVIIFRMKAILYVLLLLFSAGAFAMNPFTGDSKVITEFLKEDSGVWKDLRGPIEAIQILERKVSSPKNQISQYVIQVRTARMESSVPGSPPDFQSCLGVFRVDAEWDLMVLKKVKVKKVSLKCDG